LARFGPTHSGSCLSLVHAMLSTTQSMLAVACALLLCSLTGCRAPKARSVNAVALAARPSYSDQASREAMRRSMTGRRDMTEDYRVGPGDLLEISIFEWELRGETRTATFRVAESGTISLPVVGDLKIGGKTVAQIRKDVEEKLKEGGYIFSPRVTVDILEFRSKRIAVVGAVNDPGVYVLRQNVTTLLDVLSLAGGVSPEAGPVAYVTLGAESLRRQQGTAQARPGDHEEAPSEGGAPTGRRSVTVHVGPAGAVEIGGRKRAGTPEIVGVDLYQLLERGDLSLNMVLSDGDAIHVPMAKPISVIGYVREPGTFPLRRPMRVLEAVAMARGLMEEKASPRAAILKRLSEDGEEIISLDLVAISEGRAPDVYLQPYDVIDVRQTSWKRFLVELRDAVRYMVNFTWDLND